MRDNCSATILSSPGCNMNEHIVSPGLPSPPPMTIAGLEFRSDMAICFRSRETLESHVICMWGTWFAMSGTKNEVLTPGILVKSWEIRSRRSCHSRASALRTAHCLAAAESNQVVSHVGVIPEMRHGRRVRGSVVHAWNVVLFG